MVFAYADPSYPGHTKRGLYKGDPRARQETDHGELVSRLCDEFPDGWALSTGSNNLRAVLPLCPDDVRVGSWVKPFCSFKPNVNPAFAWEPVIWRGGRKRERFEPTLRDWLVCNATIKKGLAGAKPEEFCVWVIQLLNAKPGDECRDIYPGTGAFTSVWESTMARSA